MILAIFRTFFWCFRTLETIAINEIANAINIMIRAGRDILPDFFVETAEYFFPWPPRTLDWTVAAPNSIFRNP